ncbi:MAG: rhamnan synthesis F family protein [Tabrizicola sp.]|uniref:rhamnan synthesis F family protein n=1 Tax=Tabrizicola sp. TaxID=2005166 RepID=UPI002ABB1A28|nr:rhamnan synthesis F family protein [Tabrizicola sp.]MDZ4089375.1 rhamnan synthesis F family protein [Tabrizicola sp.]
MIPGWKVKRELLRLRQQLSWYAELLHARSRTRNYDRDRPKLVQRHDGPRSLGPRVAALLIFQPVDIPGSILETCDLLTELGYSVLVVSNGTLMAPARAKLVPHVWRLLERPNLGYDFGGYREAVMHLWDEGVEPEELLILNDSAWVIAEAFPAFLDRLRQMEVDVAGTVLRSKKAKYWLESYFFQLRRPALTSSAFREFWTHYLLVDSKFGVIRQGERDFTVALAAGGLRIGALGDNPDFLARMAEVSDEELRLAIAYAAPVPGALADERTRLLTASPAADWRLRVLAHIDAVLDGKRNWHTHFPIASIRTMGYPFLKKSREQITVDWQQLVLRAIQDGVVPKLSGQVMAELFERQKHAIKQTPQWIAHRSPGV